MRTTRHCLAVALVAVGILALCAPAHGAVRIASASRGATVGGRAQLAIVAPTGAKRCWLEFVHGRRVRQRSASSAVSGSGITWTWRVAANSRTGTWLIRAACATATRTQTASVAFRVRRGGTRFKLASQLAVSRSATQAPSGGGAITAQGPNPFPQGQCTFWAYEKRPDIYDGSSHSVSWDALHWADNARAAGFPVNGSPQVGDIVVFQPGHQGAFGTGHLAYVEGVNPDGSFSVTEMNANGNPTVTSSTRPSAAGDPGIQFIHRR